MDCFFIFLFVTILKAKFTSAQKVDDNIHQGLGSLSYPELLNHQSHFGPQILDLRGSINPQVYFHPKIVFDPKVKPLFSESQNYNHAPVESQPDEFQNQGSPISWPQTERYIVCRIGQVCVDKDICENGFFTIRPSLTQYECRTNTQMCCIYRPLMPPQKSQPILPQSLPPTSTSAPSTLRPLKIPPTTIPLPAGTNRAGVESTTLCNQLSEACVPAHQCIYGVWRPKTRTPPRFKSKCVAPEVCCRIPETDDNSFMATRNKPPFSDSPLIDETPVGMVVPVADESPPENEVPVQSEAISNQETPKQSNNAPVLRISDIARFVAMTSVRRRRPDEAPPPATTTEKIDYNVPTMEPFPIDTYFAEFPWHVLVVSESNSSHHCGGVIISENAVLSTPACVQGLEPKDILVKAGVWKFGLDEEPFKVQTLRAEGVSSDPTGFVSIDLDFVKGLRFNKHIAAVNLPYDIRDPNPSESCLILGWGPLAENGTILQRSRVTIIPNEQCQSTGSVPSDEFDYFCGRPDIEPCELDVGSGLVCLSEEGLYELKGLFLASSPCGSDNPTISFARTDFACSKVVVSVGRCIKKMIDSLLAGNQAQ